ncbi:DNA repair/recombination protein isoform X2 [Tasmannia lanceolata]|uniref:DNA repair/recombination protein isoform X2 n=1 Tax=Tasmannia lanceolata TaxID=3420 RepID=UPI004064B23C
MEEDEEHSPNSDHSDSDEEYNEEEDQDQDEEVEISSDSSSSDLDRKSQNVQALVRGNLVVQRQPLLPRVLSVTDGAAFARKPFKPPCLNGYRDQNEELVRRLWARKRFVPWGSSRPALVSISNHLNLPPIIKKDVEEESKPLPPGVEPLVLWQTEESEEGSVCLASIVVDPILVQFLRPHQREGVQFMFECVSGLSSTAGISGCILADDMGLGKTLQSITLLYTLLHQGFDGMPMVKRAMIVTPTSLVSNWESEIEKWIGRRVQLISLCESTREDVVSGIDSFLRPSSPFQVLIISYETFRMHSTKFVRNGCCDLLICDEAHRLKNDQTLTNRALAALPCSRRILLSGTPMQNDLEEFFAMVNFTNPGVLGDATYFRRYYETPIICGREPTATIEERTLGAERSAELSAKVNQFILRRTNALLSNHLPPKLIYDTIKSGASGTSGFEDCLRFFPPELFSGRSGSWTGGDGIWVELSGKMHVLARLLAHLRQQTDDRIVLVSNYTQTLDLFAQLCRERRYPYLRLDGSTSIGKRQKLVNHFNDPSKDEFVFLLSSKAGGCGLNLIGGNRLVLFDPDWNPANDKQAAARVWRDGQKKRVYIYRFLSAGTIEEKVYQRQMSKEGLQKVIQHEQMDNTMPQGNFLSTEDLRDLFTFGANVRSEIHENLNCSRCETNYSIVADGLENAKEVEHGCDSTNEGCHTDEEVSDIGGFAEIAGCLHRLKNSEKQLGTPLEEDLRSWGHHFFPTSVPDAIFQASAGDEVTFVFSNQVDGKLIPIESTASSKPQGLEGCKDYVQGVGVQNQKSLFSSQKLSKIQPPTCSTKLLRTSVKGLRAPRKPRSSLENQLPLKRMSDPPNDDFM